MTDGRVMHMFSPGQVIGPHGCPWHCLHVGLRSFHLPSSHANVLMQQRSMRAQALSPDEHAVPSRNTSMQPASDVESALASVPPSTTAELSPQAATRRTASAEALRGGGVISAVYSFVGSDPQRDSRWGQEAPSGSATDVLLGSDMGLCAQCTLHGGLRTKAASETAGTCLAGPKVSTVSSRLAAWNVSFVTSNLVLSISMRT